MHRQHIKFVLSDGKTNTLTFKYNLTLFFAKMTLITIICQI
jgi:hypothetical protein